MSTMSHAQTEITSDADLTQSLAGIRDDVAQARSRDELTRLYRHAEALVALTYSPSWRKRFGDRLDALRSVAEEGFAATARAVNRQAEVIGTPADYDETWGGKERVYGEVNSEGDLRRIDAAIRAEVATAASREDLTRLYRRAEYLITLTYAPAWEKKFGSQVDALRKIAATEFSATAAAINQRAKALGIPADYDETWGGGH